MIPFCKTTLGKEEKNAISKVIDSGWVVMGSKTEEFEKAFAEYVGGKYAVFMDSCTSALFLSLKYIATQGQLGNIRVPSLTFTATAEAIVHAGGTPVFEDVDEDFCLRTVTENSLPVNLTGNRAPRGAILCDSAHRIEKGDLAHTTSYIWCYSFYATKNMTTIQGGMVVTDDVFASNWLRQARDHGLTKGTKERYKDGKWDYSVDFVGWREKPDDIHAAIGLEQLKKLPWMTERRNALVARYNKYLNLRNTGNHLYPIVVSDRNKFMKQMHDKGIQTSVHFIPLHTMPAYKDYPKGVLKNTEFLGSRLVSLPLYPQMTKEEQDFVIKAVKEYE